MDEQTAWGRLSESAPRGRYEHARTWQKRNRQRQTFAGRIRRDPSGCWLWEGMSWVRSGRTYPLFSHRDLMTREQRQPHAFHHLVREFLPEFTSLIKGRSIPGCGVDLCINPWHRKDRRVTRQTITADQAREIYAAKGERDPGELAKSAGICRDQVLAIWRGERWHEATGATKYVPTRKVLDAATAWAIFDLRGTMSSRKAAAQFGCGYNTVLQIWRGNRSLPERPGLSQEQDA